MAQHMVRRLRDHPRIAAIAVAALGLAAVLGLAALRLLTTDDQVTSPIATSGALAEGNRLFRNGQIEEAIAAYQQGASSRPHPILAYNLGVGHHRLAQLPDAILWYRRAIAVAPQRYDPWLAENLSAARQALGSPHRPPSGLVGWLLLHPTAGRSTAVLLVWAAALWSWIGRSRAAESDARSQIMARSAPIAVACLGAAIYAAMLAAEHWGPRPAVLLADCGELPAGSEVWLDATADGWRVAGADLECQADAAGLI